MSGLPDVLSQVRDRIARYKGSRSINEQNTKASLIDPVLRALGWDVEDLDEVHREFKVKSADKPVDYALLVLRTPRLFIEAKSLGENLDDRRWANQIMGYASVAGVEWVVLTDGEVYRIYNAHAAVPVDEKLFRVVHVSEDSPVTVDTLDLLSKDRMKENLIQTLWKAHFVDRQVREAISGLFAAEPDPALVRLIRGRLSHLSPSDVRSALSRARVHIDFPVIGATDIAGRRARHPQPDPDRRRPERIDVSVPTLIKAGLIHPPLDLSKYYKGHQLTARIETDGRVTCLGDTFNSLSLAAGVARKSIIGAPPGREYPSTNGWMFWQFTDTDGERREIDVLRQRFLERRTPAPS
jgi:hypothetical protein